MEVGEQLVEKKKGISGSKRRAKEEEREIEMEKTHHRHSEIPTLLFSTCR